MRLIKCLAYAALGYVVYEIFRGMLEFADREASGDCSRDLHRAMSGDQGRMGILTGPGRGEALTTEDSDGGSSRHLVGRGVVMDT